MFSNQASYDTIRSTAAASITGSYTALGTALNNPCALFMISNACNNDVLISLDGVHDQLYLPANSFLVHDLRTNSPNLTDWFLKKGTQFYIKQGPGGASTTGSCYLMVTQLTSAAAVAPAAS